MNPNETLLYDLSNRPASYDFVTCVATSIALGMKHVRFVYGGWKRKDYTLEQAEQRWKSIVEPTPALFGLTYSIGPRYGTEVNHMIRAAIEVFNKLGTIGKIPTKCVPGDYVTLTLRRSRNPERDSNEEASREFARQCNRKVIIIPDWDEQPLHLYDRMKLYAGAYLNLGVINGTMTLCFHSDAPYVCMKTIGPEASNSTNPEFSRKNGITPGFQFPWANWNQKLSYLDDTVENLMFEYREFERRAEQRKAA